MTAYTAQQYEQNYPQGIDDYFWNLARNHVIADTLARAGLAGERILEVGCSTGVVVSYLRGHGMDCIGCELGTPPIAPERSGFIHTGMDARALPEAVRAGITVLLLCDVIEHIAEAEAFLRGLTEAFPNVRHLVVTVPARQEIWSNYDEHYGHHRRYHRPSLKAALTGAGFPALSQRYFFHALYVLMRILGGLGVTRSVEMKAPARRGLHRLLAAFCRWEARLLPGALVGASLIAVARKQGSPSA